MMHNKKLKITLIFLTLLVLTACGQNNDAQPHGAEKAKNMLDDGSYESKETSEETSVEHVVSASEDINMNVITYAEEDSKKIVSMLYPEFKIEEIDQMMETFKTEKLNNFKTLLKSESVSDKFTPQLNMTFDTNALSESIYAIQFNIDSYISEDITYNELEVIMVNLETNSILTGGDLFANDSESREHIYNTILKYMKENNNIAPYIDEDKLHSWVLETSNEFSNVHFTNDSVVFTFEQGEIAADAAGKPIIEIALDDIKKAMPENFTQLIDGEYITDAK